MERYEKLTEELTQLQNDMYGWQQMNFAKGKSVAQQAVENLLGVQEEVGELSHAHLKGLQGIRHTPEEIRKKKQDAIGDICVFLINYCSAQDINFGEALVQTWAGVNKRNWVEDPKAGGEKNPDYEVVEGPRCGVCGAQLMPQEMVNTDNEKHPGSFFHPECFRALKNGSATIKTLRSHRTISSTTPTENKQ